VRCLTSSVRHPSAVAQIVQNPKGVHHVNQFIRVIRDEEIVANSSKILRILLREDSCYEKLVRQNSELGN